MKLEDIKHEIQQADIVSFDIFDTLITRLVLHPTDVFAVVGALAEQRYSIGFNFKEIRIDAERYFIKSKNYNLDDIYERICATYLLSKEICLALKNLELEVENKVVIPRKDMLALYDKLYDSGKKIILVSDMYLSSSEIQSLLSKCGYHTENTEIFVSNERNALKADGSLWNVVSEKYASQTIVHLGDNFQSDNKMAKKRGIIPISILSSFEAFQRSKIYNTLSAYDDGSVGNSLLLGRLCNQMIFNNALSADYNHDEVLGLFNGAAFSCFMRWLINTHDDSLLLFVTREGFIFQPMYLAYCESAGIEPQKNCLFYSSRQAVSRASIRNMADLEDLLSMTYSGTLSKFVVQKCGCPFAENEIKDMWIILPRDKGKAMKALEGHLDKLIKNSQEAREIYSTYIDSCCAENGCDTLTIVDIGYLATTQFLLTKVTDKKIFGKYLITDVGVYEPIRNCVVSLGKIEETAHPIHNNPQFFESSIQVPYGQLLEVNRGEDGVITFKFNSAKQTSPVIINAQKECLAFSKKDAEWYGYLGKKYDYSLGLAEDIWMCLLYYNYLPTEYINSFRFDDDFNGNEMFSYDPKLHAFKTSTLTIPFVFTKNKNSAFRKQKLKNFVKNYTPYFLYLPLKKIWIKYIK